MPLNAAGIRTEAPVGLASPAGAMWGHNGRPGGTRRAPGDARGVVRVGGGSGERGEVGGRDAEGEFVHVGFAEDDRARVQQRPEHGRVLGGAEVVQRGCSGGRGQVFGVDVVFDDDGKARQAAERRCGPAGRRRCRQVGGQRARAVQGDHCAPVGELLGAVQEGSVYTVAVRSPAAMAATAAVALSASC